MRVLLTGGGGMVGRNILEHPKAKSGAFEIFAPRSRELDLLSRDATLEYVKKTKPDIVIHSAGRVGGIQANMAAPVDFLVENIDMARNIIGAAAAADVPRLINMGSSCMYPRNAENPLREEMVLKGELEPTNEGYAIAKVFAQRYGEYLSRQRPELQYKTLIPCNLYGRYDKFDPKHSHLIPAIIHKLHVAKLENQPTVDIWGDGMARREFMDASDLADFTWTAVEKFESVPPMLNVGLGHDHTINEYYETVKQVIGYRGGFTHDLSKPTGMKQKLCSVEKLAAFGWKAKTSLEDGIRRAYDYYLSQEPV